MSPTYTGDLEDLKTIHMLRRFLQPQNDLPASAVEDVLNRSKTITNANNRYQVLCAVAYHGASEEQWANVESFITDAQSKGQ